MQQQHSALVPLAPVSNPNAAHFGRRGRDDGVAKAPGVDTRVTLFSPGTVDVDPARIE
jgi:hypothetical protein